PTGNDVIALAVVPGVPGSAYAGTIDRGGIFKTIDGGVSWRPVNRGLISSEYAYAYFPSINAILVDPRNSDTVYVATNEGAFRSTDAAMNWEPINQGMLDTVV